MLTRETIEREAARVHPRVVELRRTIHREPELGLATPKTQAVILAELARIGIGHIVSGVACTSVWVDIEGAAVPVEGARRIALRADMDALPLTEHADVDWVSREDGKMHACGHDGHVAMLLGAAEILHANRHAFAGTVRLLFQPGEEGYGGAKIMIREGALDGVDAAFALHLEPSRQPNLVALRRGTTLIGIHSACYRGRTEPFSAQQERIARGIAQLASLALENARLVEELNRASRVKSDFLATMSHELRTPLNAIVGYTSLLIDGAYGRMEDEQVQVLRRLDKSACELLELINSTLDVSRLEAGRMPMDIRDVSVSELLHEVDAETRGWREKPGLEFVWDVPARLPRLRTDPLKLKVILKNLIGNAVKFTDHGSVRVGARRVDRGVVEFSVEDTGIGIDPSARSVIFEPFRQGDSSDSRRHGGVGLGLYVVRRLVDTLGGDLALESDLGRGSTFRVSVPTKQK